MIYLDTTNSGDASHRSGLTRVTQRLAAALGSAARMARWNERRSGFVADDGARPERNDWILTAELFSEDERPGLSAFLARRPCRLAAIFHDAIPLRFPHTTWPRSVARHPGYLKLLGGFDRVWAVSRASADDLTGYWHWLGLELRPRIATLALGSDFDSAPRATIPAPASRSFVCTGILEPRKNQSFLVDVCSGLWREGLDFELNLVGRVNPQFGKPILEVIRRAEREFPDHLKYHEAAGDEQLARLLASARATVFPTLAEGCGLPLLESLWRGVPCVCSDLPVLRENADGGGCVPIRTSDATAWASALRRILDDDGHHAALVEMAIRRPLPGWADTARTLIEGLKD